MVGLDQTMSSSPNRGSKAAGTNSRPSSKDGSKKNIWSSLLDGVANGKRLPEKNLLILGTFRARELLYRLTAWPHFTDLDYRRYPGKPEGIPGDLFCKYLGRPQFSE